MCRRGPGRVALLAVCGNTSREGQRARGEGHHRTVSRPRETVPTNFRVETFLDAMVPIEVGV